MDRNLAAEVAASSIVPVRGRFHRHTSPKFRVLKGSRAGGRWGPQNAYPVIYLGRPVESVVAEAHRHLVDDVPGMRADLIAPRLLFDVDVDVTEVLDLRDPDSRDRVGLDLDALAGGHGPCQRVGQAAHQLGLHGVLAPSATELGDTLALFERHLPEHELPIVVDETQWDGLPEDPRTPEQTTRQRLVR